MGGWHHLLWGKSGSLLDIQNEEYVVFYLLSGQGPGILSWLSCYWYFRVSVHREWIPAVYPGGDPSVSCLTMRFFFFNAFFFKAYLFIHWLIDWLIDCCVGSSFLCEGSLQLRRAGATLHRGARASHHRGLSCCGAQAPDAQAQQLWLTGLVAPWHVGSSQTRARTHVPCIGSRPSTTAPPGKLWDSYIIKWRRLLLKAFSALRRQYDN